MDLAPGTRAGRRPRTRSQNVAQDRRRPGAVAGSGGLVLSGGAGSDRGSAFAHFGSSQTDDPRRHGNAVRYTERAAQQPPRIGGTCPREPAIYGLGEPHRPDRALDRDRPHRSRAGSRAGPLAAANRDLPGIDRLRPGRGVLFQGLPGFRLFRNPRGCSSLRQSPSPCSWEQQPRRCSSYFNPNPGCDERRAAV